MTLFEYVVFYSPTDKEIEKGQLPKILTERTMVMAKDAASVQLMAAKKIPDEYDAKLDRIQVAVRPF